MNILEDSHTDEHKNRIVEIIFVFSQTNLKRILNAISTLWQYILFAV